MNIQKKRSKISVINAAFFILVAVFFAGCANDEMPLPKPPTYYRIDFAGKNYQMFDSANYPYTFMCPDYAHVVPCAFVTAEPYWVDIEFPKYKATINISYKKIPDRDVLKYYINDCYTFVSKHFDRSSGVLEQEYSDPSHGVYGLIYDIKGVTVASPCQFYLTDSNKHFLRGSLYFDCPPNNDSLQPVIDYIRKDIDRLVETLRWR